MYYLIYIPLYLLSLLPIRVLYLLGDAVYVLIYYIIGYRKKVVMDNLGIAFPEKTEAERKTIAKEFYRNFIDTFIETIKFLSWKWEDVEKRFSVDLSGIEKGYKYNKPIHLIGMHNFNWEYVNWSMPKKLKWSFVAIYLPIGNKAFDRIIYKMRTQTGSIMISATEFRRQYAKLINTNHVLGSAADQSPGNPTTAYWVDFFGRPTAFVTGPEKGAKFSNATLVFTHFYKTKRGYYSMDTRFITAHSANLPDGEITRLYARYIEECLRKQPANYLWSHRRWKYEWNEEYSKRLIKN